MRQEGQLQARTIVRPALTQDGRDFVRHGLAASPFLSPRASIGGITAYDFL
jgi:hypothetical protein